MRARRLAVLLSVAAASIGGPVAVASPASAATALSTMESQVVTLVNQARADAGCGKVRMSGRLVRAARAHSADMAKRGYFSHVSQDGRTFTQRAAAAGHAKAIGENIAWGQRSAVEVTTAWLNSPGHRANILNCAAVTVGMGAAKNGNGVVYWTQVFGA